MVHRRTLYDDALGVSEPINEPGADEKGLVVRGKLNMIFTDVLQSASLHRELAHRVNSQPLVLIAPEQAVVGQTETGLKSKVGDLLPANVHLLTVAKDFDSQDEELNSVIVRFEHFYEKGEDALLSLPATINVMSLFDHLFNITNIEELALGANMKVEELNDRLRWNAEDSELNAKPTVVKASGSGLKKNAFEYNLNPMQIRTFRIWYLPRSA
jgi:hypothetical protein